MLAGCQGAGSPPNFARRRYTLPDQTTKCGLKASGWKIVCDRVRDKYVGKELWNKKTPESAAPGMWWDR